MNELAGVDPAVVGTVVAVAGEVGVDPRLAVTEAWVESGFDPRAEGDYSVDGIHLVPKGTPGAVPTSFGLYQLHKGGELGLLTPEQAMDPRTNANVALGHIAAVHALNPRLGPGALAALAQGPEDPAAYAATIDAIYGSALAGALLALATQAPLGGLAVDISPTARTGYLSALEARIPGAAPGQGYVLHADGGVFTVPAPGGPPFYGSYPGLPASVRNAPRVFLSITPRDDGKPGYCVAANDGDPGYNFGPDIPYPPA